LTVQCYAYAIGNGSGKEGREGEVTVFLLARERLQIDTDLLRIITSTADELSGGTNIDDLERP